jgi:archaellum biogenesis protein FlaJ (TadC family)
MGGIGSVIAYFVGSLLWKANPKYPFFMAALLMILSFVILFTFIKEKRDVLEYETNSEVKEKSKLSSSVIIAVIMAVVLWIILFFGTRSLWNMDLKYRMPLSTIAA